MTSMFYFIDIDQLIEKLNRAGVWYSVDGISKNNISYADDMVLLIHQSVGLKIY